MPRMTPAIDLTADEREALRADFLPIMETWPRWRAVKARVWRRLYGMPAGDLSWSELERLAFAIYCDELKAL